MTDHTTWRSRCAPVIASVLRATEGLEPKDRRRALREAYPFGERKRRPYVVWLDEIKRQTGRQPTIGRARASHPSPVHDPRQLALPLGES